MKSNYSLISVDELAKKLGRSCDSVKHKAKLIGASLSRKELSLRYSIAAKKAHEQMGGMHGENNPNWKGGISKDNYHYKRIQRQRYPEKIKAREAVSRAVKSGKLKRLPCEVCGDQNSQAHHEDYSRPLDVVWLCRKHHRQRHCS